LSISDLDLGGPLSLTTAGKIDQKRIRAGTLPRPLAKTAMTEVREQDWGAHIHDWGEGGISFDFDSITE
jgi:hypothetical protein